jgi:hypothetical protein
MRLSGILLFPTYCAAFMSRNHPSRSFCCVPICSVTDSSTIPSLEALREEAMKKFVTDTVGIHFTSTTGGVNNGVLIF